MSYLVAENALLCSEEWFNYEALQVIHVHYIDQGEATSNEVLHVGQKLQVISEKEFVFSKPSHLLAIYTKIVSIYML